MIPPADARHGHQDENRNHAVRATGITACVKNGTAHRQTRVTADDPSSTTEGRMTFRAMISSGSRLNLRDRVTKRNVKESRDALGPKPRHLGIDTYVKWGYADVRSAKPRLRKFSDASRF
jgi:hypothetical protein